MNKAEGKDSQGIYVTERVRGQVGLRPRGPSPLQHPSIEREVETSTQYHYVLVKVRLL